MSAELINIIALKDNKIFDLSKENERLKASLKTIVATTGCDGTWDFAERILQGEET